MAFTRKMLKAMGIEEEKIDEIIEAHREVTDALKEDRDRYKVDADKFADTKKELEDLKKMVEGTDSYKEKYEREHEAFEAFKKDVESKNLKEQKKDAYKELLKKAGIADKFMDKILKMTSFEELEMDENGIKDADKLIEGIKKDYDIFLVKEGEVGAKTETPPTNTGGVKMTRDEIFKRDERGRYVLTAQERQKAIAESLNQ